MKNFIYQSAPYRIVFGSGTLNRVKSELEKLSVKRVLVLTTPKQEEHGKDVEKLIGNLCVGVYPKAVMHVPIETVNLALKEVERLDADCCIAIGGGSTVGLAKAIAKNNSLPYVAIATTYAGSEMTSIWGVTNTGIKTTGRDPRVLPKVVIYDPELTVGLPIFISGPSGMNAIAHCVEALYAQDRNPIINLIAEEGIRSLAESLPAIIKKPSDIEARSKALYGALLAGTSLNAVGMAIHHKLCHTLGGSFNLPHADVHTVIIPYVAEFNRDAAKEAMNVVARALGTNDAARGLYDLSVSIGAKTALKEIGMKENELNQAAEIATQNPYYNPREITRKDMRELLQKAFDGERP